MHYKNGREAKVGDKIVGRDVSGSPLAGVVIDRYPETDRCNLIVAPLTCTYTASACDCVHVEDLEDVRVQDHDD